MIVPFRALYVYPIIIGVVATVSSVKSRDRDSGHSRRCGTHHDATLRPHWRRLNRMAHCNGSREHRCEHAMRVPPR